MQELSSSYGHTVNMIIGIIFINVFLNLLHLLSWTRRSSDCSDVAALNQLTRDYSEILIRPLATSL